MKNHDNGHQHSGPYQKLAVMALVSFAAMFCLMYSMVDRFENIFINVNQVYMAALMTAPMVAIEIAIMGMMYKDKKVNYSILGVCAVTLFGSYFAIRMQTSVNDEQFLRSMIPHHAGAILMCEEANITDPEIKKLCESIMASQREEISQMKKKLAELRADTQEK